ncbi:hypothetical protein [Streptomyces klenkii]
MPVKVVFFNVGQGDCSLMIFHKPGASKGHAAVLLDCGSTKAVAPKPPTGAPAPVGTAKDRMVSHLKQKIDKYLQDLETPGVLDYLLITHPDQDHFNLLESVLLDDTTRKLRYTVNNIWYGMARTDYKEGNRSFIETLLGNPAALTSAAGHRVVNPPLEKPTRADPEPLFPEDTATPNLFLLGGGMFVPTARRGPTWFQNAPKETIANLGSLVFSLVGVRDSNGLRQKVLFMADAFVENEQVLIGLDSSPSAPQRWCRREKNLWLKVGHHGSKTSTSREWLEHATPDGLFLSTGPLAFGGQSATCTESNVNRRMLVEWEAVRTAQGIPAPKVTGRKPWGYGYQDDVPPNMLPWPFRFHEAKERGIFSTLAGEPTPASGGEWTGVDWHMWIDRAGAGTYDLWYE